MNGEPIGIGLGLRLNFASRLLQTARAVDWLEIVPEQWLGIGGKRSWLSAQCAEKWTIVPHGTSLSIGGPDPIDDAYVVAMRELVRRIDAPDWSDHICYSNIDGVRTRELLPLPFSDEAVEHTVKRIAQLQARVDVPLVFENITFYVHMSASVMGESSFVSAILEEAQVEMLLDVNNVYVNSMNHGYDPADFIDKIPLSRVRQIHGWPAPHPARYYEPATSNALLRCTGHGGLFRVEEERVRTGQVVALRAGGPQ